MLITLLIALEVQAKQNIPPFLTVFIVIAWFLGFPFMILMFSIFSDILREFNWHIIIPKIFIGFYCFYIPYVLYYGAGVVALLNLLQTLSGNLITVFTFFILISAAFSNYYRYKQAKEYGVPLKLTKSNVNDDIDIFVNVAIVMGTNIAIPLFLAFSNPNEQMVQPTILLIIISLLCGVVKNFTVLECLNKMKNKLWRIFANSLLLVGLSIFAIASVLFHGGIMLALVSSEPIQYDLLANIDIISWEFAIVAFGLSSYLIASLVFSAIITLNILGKSVHQKEIGLTIVDVPISKESIETVTYIAIIKHSADKWILIPCEVEKTTVYYKKQLKALTACK